MSKQKILIIGSGASGVQAASRLLERGLEVEMLDCGERSSYTRESLPRRGFSELRKNDEEQHLYFLGKNYEGIFGEDIKTGNKLSPLMKHVLAAGKNENKTISDDFVMNQSFARGGLAQAWGAGALPLREVDLIDYPFNLNALIPYYDMLAGNIGISGAEDDLSKILYRSKSMQAGLAVDTPSEKLFENYNKLKQEYNTSGLHMGRAWMAICSESLPGRDACEYLDTEFWGDANRAVYRPEWTLEKLEKEEGFSYVADVRISTFRQSTEDDDVIVEAVSETTKQRRSFRANGLILAAGVPGSAKIALQSANLYGEENAVPIRTNAYTYVPCLFPALLGLPVKDKRSSLAQLSMLFEPEVKGTGAIFSSIFTYRSMLIFKLLREVSLPYNFALEIFRKLQQSFVIVTIFHEDKGGGDKRLWLENTANDPENPITKIVYKESTSVLKEQHKTEKLFLKQIRKLGLLLPLKRINRKAGSSIHYSGTLPHSNDNHRLNCDVNGRLNPYKKVWVVDGSTLPTMPAILPTNTIMANSLRIADKIADKFLKVEDT